MDADRGAALVGFYTAHRTTRDLDLFWHGQERLGDVERRLLDAGLAVERLQTTTSFVQLRVSGGGEQVLVDLVADPVPVVEPPQQLAMGVLVDTPHEILVNKLTTLIQRSELRDLEDVRVLVEAGGDLEQAIADAPRKDSGFSPLTLAWLLRSLPVSMSARLGFDERALRQFRDALVEKMSAQPGR